MSPWHKGRVQVSGGFVLLAGWFALINGWELLLTIVCAAALHELGHYLVLVLAGAQVTALRVSVFGAEMETACVQLSYGKELAVALAGPAVNLFCGLLLAQVGQAVHAGAHLTLCAFNLLPVRPLDGGRALFLLVSWMAGPAAGEWATRWIGGCMALLLGLCVVWLIWRSGGSLWLLPAAAGLLCAGGRELLGGV